MLRWWTAIFPLFFIKWYARKYCERVSINGDEFAEAYTDVLIWVPKKRQVAALREKE